MFLIIQAQLIRVIHLIEGKFIMIKNRRDVVVVTYFNYNYNK